MARFFIPLILLAAISCKEISFHEPQPKGKKALKSFPQEIQGNFLVFENGELSKDTVVIHANGYRLGYFEKGSGKKDRYDEGTLGDSFVLKSYDGYYFVNFLEKPEWLLRVIKVEKNGDLMFMTPQQEKDTHFNDYIKRLGAEIRIDSSVVEDKTIYQIDPSPKQLVSLVEKGFFTKEKLQRIK